MKSAQAAFATFFISILSLAAMSLGFVSIAHADEGMWTFDNVPVERIEKAYGFKPTQAWLDHLRMSSVRLAGGCSASFVSAEGLVQTNHHCARGCIAQLSTPDSDMIAQGYYAATTGDEKKCPQIEANQLISITDVTKRVSDATAGRDGKAYISALNGVRALIAKECSAGDETKRCDVVELYHGGQYHLYTYRRYQDVRLVMAPEFSIAFFGGDPDNFEFPRYNLDVSYLRVYANGKPLDTSANYLKYAADDVKEGDLVFTSGHPGSTSRLDTLAQLEFLRDVQLPRQLFYMSEMRGMLTEFQNRGSEQRRIANDMLFGIENSMKAYKGRFAALVDPTLIRERAISEAELQKRIDADPEMKATYGEAIANISTAMAKYRDLRDRMTMTEGRWGLRSTLLANAITFVRYAAESNLPEEARLREYTTANFTNRKQSLTSDAPIYPELEKATLIFSLTKLREILGPDDPFVRKVFGKRSAEEIANDLIDRSTLVDGASRRKLFEGGKAAIDASVDPMIVFARLIDSDLRAIRKTFEDEIESVLTKNKTRVALAMFKIYGTSTYPDATFTLRLSYGSVKSFMQRGQMVNPITRFAGLYDRSTGLLDSAVPSDAFRLPKRWWDAKSRISANQAFNFASTNDIIGGNSGSPVVNAKSEMVGLIFDGNIASLGGDFGYDGDTNRAVSVNVGALREALGKVYGADRILAELKR
jgi:hypothetical protein